MEPYHKKAELGTVSAAQSIRTWLPVTQIWNYFQLKYLPPEIDNLVVCEKRENETRFPFSKIYSLSEAPLWFRLWKTKMQKRGLNHYLQFLKYIVKQNNCTLLHSHFGDMGWLNSGVAQESGMKHIVSFYGYDLSRLPCIDPQWLNRYRRLFGMVDLVLCEGRHMIDRVRALGCPTPKVVLHRLGIETERVPFRPRNFKQGETIRFLIAASFQEKKGIPYALEAVGRMKGTLGNFEVTVIGDAKPHLPRSLTERKKIIETIERFNLGRHIRLLGFKAHDELLREVYRHHVFLSPSVTASDGDTEGGAPVSIIEMAATGMPVISTTHCDIPDTLGQLNRGLLCAERDIEGLIVQIERLLSCASWRKLASENRAHIEKEFSASTQGKKLARLYSNLVSTGEIN